MSDVKKKENKKEIQDEKLDKVSGGAVFPPYPHPNPRPAPDPHPSPRPQPRKWPVG